MCNTKERNLFLILQKKALSVWKGGVMVEREYKSVELLVMFTHLFPNTQQGMEVYMVTGCFCLCCVMDESSLDGAGLMLNVCPLNPLFTS